jgi:hypothetical protein
LEVSENAAPRNEATHAIAEQSALHDVPTNIDQEQTAEQMVNGHNDNVTSPEIQQESESSPILYDMDLEKMHADLYKGKYLTPHDFLDDVKKIVHNAGVRFTEDPERLYRAQAMLIASQVSIHEFDPQLRLECDRMAVRERKRREEHRKSKEKKAHDEGGNVATHVSGIRRSARHIGQQPEISITDPLRLERTLKRQRNGEVAVDSQVSEEETGEGRTTKRTKMVISDDEDPLNDIGPTSQPRPVGVRFAATESPGNRSRSLPQDDSMLSEVMAVDYDVAPQRTGFDPFLLNPLPDPPDVFSAGLFPHPINGVMPPSSTSDIFQSSQMQALTQSSLNLSPPHTPVRPSGLPESSEVRRSLTPIIPERSPTPHPDFHINEEHFCKLKHDLRSTTGNLTVEQLEQLRAVCLGCVWRHRSNWDRSELLVELLTMVNDFVSKVREVDRVGIVLD